ncbi:uncharacterized protein FFC1_15899 [Fusarium fujikuroi]|nr:uncharacterized protein FFC1_15899 [Fusarium fujikuroi]
MPRLFSKTANAMPSVTIHGDHAFELRLFNIK